MPTGYTRRWWDALQVRLLTDRNLRHERHHPRCQTCPRAFCEDCLPDDVEMVGENLPQLYVPYPEHFSRLTPHCFCRSIVLNFPAKRSAYFVNCHHCREYGKHDPVWRKEWDFDIAKAQRQVQALYSGVGA
jgi:SWI/SNF-related matrix-associated actin-dependent regulator of chromatin subfamily A member 5